MLFVYPILWSLAIALVSAQSPSTRAPAPTTTTTSSTGRATHTVKVGAKEAPHDYMPYNITAAVGDVIVFEFYPRNHSVVKADYMAPCVPADGDFFYSGVFNNFNENDGQLVGPPPTWSLVVNDTEPTFFYCTAIDSCTKNGMVGVINPNATMTYEAQHAKALEYPYMLVPGQSAPAEGSNSDSTSSPSSTGSSSSSGSGLSGGAIAGIVVGVIAFIGILAALFFVLGRNRVYRQWMSSQDGRNERTARWALFNHSTGKSEMDSSTQPAGDHPTYMASPDPNERTFSPALGSPGMHSTSMYGAPSPQPQVPGQWSWEFQQQSQPVYHHPPPAAPTELEASSVVPVTPEMKGPR